MKALKVLVLVLGLSFIPQKHAESAVGGAVALTTGSPYIAISGLLVLGGSSVVINRSSSDISDIFNAMIWMIVGLTLLDGEEGQAMGFVDVETNVLLDQGLTIEEAYAYQDSIEELNLVFSVVSSQLNNDSTAADAAALWEQHGQLLDDDALSGAIKLVKGLK